MTCTIGLVGTSTECSDTTDTIAVSAGDTVSLAEVNSNASAPATTSASRLAER